MTLLLMTLTAPAAAHPGARPGEGFTFKFALGPVEGGRARMAVGQPALQGQRRVLPVHGEAETTAFVKILAKVSDDYQLLVDAASLLPLSVKEHERGMRERRVTATIDGRIADVELWSPQRQLKGRRILPRIARDPLSSFFALRALPLDDGQKIGLDVIDGPVLWRVELTVKRGEKVRLEADGDGPSRPAIRIDGVAARIDDGGRPKAQPPRKMTIWLGDDRDRALLRMEADTDLGRCALELTSYLPGPRAPALPKPQLPGIEVH